MKKILLAVSCTIIALSAHAQKSSWYIGGNVGFNSTTSKTEGSGPSVDGAKTTSWSFSPEIGTFLTNNVQLGLGLTMAGSKWDARTAIKNESTTMYMGATLYSRYFFGKGSFRPFVGINIMTMPGKKKATTDVAVIETKMRTFGANLNAGFAYGLSSRVCVVGSFGTFGFESSSSEVEGSNTKQKTSSFGLDAGSLGSRFNVGVYYTFKN